MRLVLDIIKMATAENRFIALWAAGVTQVYLGTTQSCQKYFLPNRTAMVVAPAAYICLIIPQLAAGNDM